MGVDLAGGPEGEANQSESLNQYPPLYKIDDDDCGSRSETGEEGMRCKLTQPRVSRPRLSWKSKTFSSSNVLWRHKKLLSILARVHSA